MPIVPNTYYQNPGIGQIVSNIGTALFGDPEARAKRDVYGAQVQNYRAEADKYRADTSKVQAETRPLLTRADQYDAMPATLASVFAYVPGETPEAHSARIAPFIGKMLQAGGGNSAEMGNGLQDLFSTALAADGTDQGGRTGLIIGGHTPGKDFAGTAVRADQIESQNAAEDRKTKYGVANIDQAGATTRTGMTIAGENNRFFNAPINAGEGNTIYLAPTDPRYGKVGGVDGVVRGAPTAATVRGAAGQRMYEGDTNPSLPGLFNGSGGVPKPGAKAAGNITQGQAITQARRDFENYRKKDPKGVVYNSDGSVANADVWITDRAKHYQSGMAPAAPVAAPAAAPTPQQVIPPPEKRPVGTKARGIDGVERVWNGQAWVGAPLGGT